MDTAQFNNLSRRVGTQWALAAAQPESNTPAVVEARRRWASALLGSSWMAANDLRVRKFLAQPTAPSVPATAPSKAYKPAHGGYPG